MKNIVIYTRVSSKEQVDDGNSLSTQRQVLYDYAETNSLNIIKHFEERGESAKTANRHELQKMLVYCAEHQSSIDTVVVHKFDRFSRRSSDHHELRQYFKSLNIEVFAIAEPTDNTPSGKFMEAVFAARAEYDNDNRSEQSKSGMRTGVKDGRWMWKAPMGFVNGRIEGRRNIVPDPETAYVSALCVSWNLIANGHSMEAARKLVNFQLADIGRKPIALQSFSRMLRNKIYIGIVCGFGLEVQSSSIKPLVDPELFYDVQEVLTGNRNKGNKYTKNNPKYPLRGILWCRNGHKLTASSPRGRGGVYPKYHCPKCRGKGTSFSVDDTEARFMQFIKPMHIKNDVREALKEAIRLNLDEADKQNTVERKAIHKRTMTIEAEKDVLLDKIINGTISDATGKQRLNKYDQELIKLRMDLNTINEKIEDAEELMEFGISKLTNLSQTIEEIEDINVRARFQKWLFPAGITYDGEIFGTTQIPLIYRVNKNALADAFVTNSRLVIPRGIEPRLPG